MLISTSCWLYMHETKRKKIENLKFWNHLNQFPLGLKMWNTKYISRKFSKSFKAWKAACILLESFEKLADHYYYPLSWFMILSGLLPTFLFASAQSHLCISICWKTNILINLSIFRRQKLWYILKTWYEIDGFLWKWNENRQNPKYLTIVLIWTENLDYFKIF